MRNIPMFTTESGVASLILEEIPYKRSAYIRIQSAGNPEQLLKDAVDLCCAAGASTVYATGSEQLMEYPLHTEIWEMTCHRSDLAAGSGKLISVNADNIDDWVQQYNCYMADIPNAATMTSTNAKKLLETQDAYFVHCEDVCIGCGKAKDDKIDVVISLVSGKGSEVLLTLCSALQCDLIKVEVASSNKKAVRLYEKNGFVKSGIISQWYKVV